MTRKYKAENILPYEGKDSKGTQVKRMFDSIAHSYDSLNITLSMGIDRLWRRYAMKSLKTFSPKIILDVATGTADMAILENRKLSPEKIIGIDLSEGMLEVGRKKIRNCSMEDTIFLECQDCLNLKFDDNSFDAVTVGFGVRNFESLERGFAEMYRVLRPGGVLLVLELSTPVNFPMKQLYSFYSSTVIPALGKVVSKDKSAYDYLNKSVKAVPQGEQMASIFRNAGFNEVVYDRYTFGICTNYRGIK
ncbi:MAG: bifunctional demethylmenaquinone methyltransferase/2-methoxy-6-polyprenyl-1,4-benzoquinol methylase UbiE [Bacteroidales bacterium]|nr:bifunctional demethylmenaquinone methyltransferase/2-methoxy-6-polyprenyl-1,4-benzoquinol methylase UbiE [Bacteroidales bacterium]